MRAVKSNLLVLVANKSQHEGRRLTLRRVSEETGVSYKTLRAIATNTIRELPTDVLAKLCDYFQCELSDLLFLSEE
jgi:putative transcriptional regulator